MLRVSAGWGVLVIVLGLAMLRVSVWSYHRGFQAAEVQQARAMAVAEARLAQVTEAVRRSETARLATESARDALSRQLEDMAHADPDGGRVALGVDSVRRLNRR